jgi:hypothetical protein
LNPERLNINMPEGAEKLLIGSDFHTLNDKTNSTIKTNTLEDFEIVAKVVPTEGNHILLDHNSAKIVASTVDRYTKPAAVCTLIDSDPLTRLVQANKKSMDFGTFVIWLESMKRFLSTAEDITFLSELRHFKFRKIASAEISDDRRGNYSYKFALESSGKDDFEPVKTLNFKVPVFKFIPENLEISFDLLFDVKNPMNEPTFLFTLQSFELEELIEARKREIVNKGLQELPHPKVWGTLETTLQDDSWAYKPNPEKSH